MLLVGAVVMLPLVALPGGDPHRLGRLAAGAATRPARASLNGDLALALHIGSYVMFVAVVVLVYRFVPAEPPSRRAFLLPGDRGRHGLGLFTQVFSLLAPLLTQSAAIYGTFVAAFAILAWMSISFNLLLLGAAGRGCGRWRSRSRRRRARPAAGGGRGRLLADQRLARAAAAAEARVGGQRQAAADARLRCPSCAAVPPPGPGRRR